MKSRLFWGLIFILPSWKSYPIINKIQLQTGVWAPYTDPTNADKPGVVLEIVKGALALEKINLDITNEPWARVEKDLIKKNSFSCGYIKTPEREKIFHFSDNIFSSETILFAHDSNFKWTEKTFTQNLSNKIIGVTRGYSYSEKWDKIFADSAKNNLIIEVTNSDEINFKKLASGRIDVFVVDKYVGLDLIDRVLTAEEKKQVHPIKSPIIFKTELYFICSKKNKDCDRVIKSFNNGLLKFKQTENYKKIITKYGFSS